MSGSYAPYYKTGYGRNTSSQTKTFSNDNSIDSNDFRTNSFGKTGAGETDVRVKTFNPSPLTYKLPIISSSKN
jgi:hypothetical protein